ncbi:MAG: hypothetical protein OIF40_11340 [Mangrovicoccus sp.]|nr:hypothetical protein [Mangrovicoccus sp.]
MLKQIRTVSLALMIAISSSASFAADLYLVRSFKAPGPSGLAYDPEYCGLWVVNETREVVLMNLWGNEIRRFTAELGRVDAIALEGEDLLLSDGNGTYQKVTREGGAKSRPYRLSNQLFDTDGLFFDAQTRDYWVADDTMSQLLRVRADGQVTQRVYGQDQNPQMMEPQGITRDPHSGNILAVDDADASDSLFEFAPDGRLLDVISLEFAGLDAEGITVQPETQTIFVAFDDGDMIAAFQYVATPNGLPPAPLGPGRCMVSQAPIAEPPA